MNPERWQQVRELLDQALAVSDADRPALLDARCSGDAELRLELESLLRSHQQAGSVFLNRPAGNLSAIAVASSEEHTRIGRRVGVYRLVEQIGQGGMGEIYRAVRDDGQYNKEVAIKFVRFGLDTAGVLERFRHERQVLASLDHPNIAGLLDGGTTQEGIPYLVMELIEGTPLDQYCEARKLSTAERLGLFLQVCSAVQFAHQHLVIHRDIKPGNILVTGEGVPKLLDFGIAKLLDPSVASATTMANPMTPEFASPEQVRGEPVTTSTDVYSLGVVLFQLLTGRSPYPGKTHGPHEFARAICEYSPPKPSSVVVKPLTKTEVAPSDTSTPQSPLGARAQSPAKLRRQLSGDLDDIVLMALRKEPQRRYPSVDHFAEDIRRHLGGLPVIARHDSWRYRAGKFVARHTLGVAATSVVLLAIAGGVVATIREARIASANERRADERFNDVRKMANSLMFEIHDAIRDLPGSTPARRLIVSRALEYLDSLSSQSKGDVSLEKEMAAAYDRVGDVLGYPYGANLGDSPGALQSYRKALAIREALSATTPNDASLQKDMVAGYFRLAQVLESVGNFSEALAMLAKAQPISEHLATGSKDPVLADLYGGGYYFTASIQIRTGDFSGALDNYRRSAAIREAALKDNPDNLSLRVHLPADYGGIAKCLAFSHDLPHAIEMQAKATSLLNDVSKANPGNATLSEYLGEGFDLLANYHNQIGESAAGLDTYQQAHKIFSDLLDADPKNSLARANFGFSNLGLANSLRALGKTPAAIKIFRESITFFEAMSPRTAGNRYPRSGLASAYSGLGETYLALAGDKSTSAKLKQQYWTEAHSSCQMSLSVWKDKEKRGEMESDELEVPQKVAQCVADAEAHLRIPSKPAIRQ